jgi:hypothetical protein
MRYVVAASVDRSRCLVMRPVSHEIKNCRISCRTMDPSARDGPLPNPCPINRTTSNSLGIGPAVWQGPCERKAAPKSLKAVGNAVSMMIQEGLQPIRQFLRTYDESHLSPHSVLDPNSTARFHGHRAQYKLGPWCSRYKSFGLAVSRESCCHPIQHVHSANKLNSSPPILYPKLLDSSRPVPYRTSKLSISFPDASLRD